MGTSPRHGFDDDEATARLLRSPPSDAALRWAADVAGAEVADWTVLRGGTSSAMYVLDLADGSETRVVLRCYVRPEVNDEEPELAEREAAALRTVSAIDVPTPELIAVDPAGAEVGIPAVLMTWLPGRVVWDPRNTAPWLSSLASLLPAIHRTETVPPDAGDYANYRQRSYEHPRWATNRSVWEEAVEIFHGPILETDRCFIHRDFHPGNVLWRGRHVSGLVDWQAACSGPPSIDISHCRANLLRHRPELADEYTRIAEAATARTFHPWADIATLIGMLDGLRSRPPRPAGRRAIEAALARAVSACR